MARLTILQDPDPRLRIKAKPVATFDAALERLVEDLFETMYAAPGVGLAATQVGIAQRIAETAFAICKRRKIIDISDLPFHREFDQRPVDRSNAR